MTWTHKLMMRLLGLALNKFKGNKSVWESKKVNPAITYMNKPDSEKQAITQEWERPSISGEPSTDVQVAS